MLSVRNAIILGILITALLLTAGCTQQTPADTCDSDGSGVCALPSAAGVSPGATTLPQELWKQLILETTMGNITIALDPDMPITAGNFEKLAQNGYYDGVIFHRVIDGFMIQGGDPTGTGHGGPGYTIKDEFTSHNRNSRGAVAMGNTGYPNTGGSQFFINLVDNNVVQGPTFDRKYPVFGNVVEGMDVVDTIGKTKTDPGNRPLQNVTIIRAVVI